MLRVVCSLWCAVVCVVLLCVGCLLFCVCSLWCAVVCVALRYLGCVLHCLCVFCDGLLCVVRVALCSLFVGMFACSV